MAETPLGKQLQQFVDDLEKIVLDSQKVVSMLKKVREDFKGIGNQDDKGEEVGG